MDLSVKGILFDKDGTLFDFSASWGGWAQGFIARLAKGDAALAQRIGHAIGFDPILGQFQPDSVVIAATNVEIAAAIANVLPDAEGVVELIENEAATAPQQEAVPLAPFLEGLRARGLWLGVATNDGEAPARAHLQAAGVLAHFDFIAGYDSGYGGKPGPGQLRAFYQTAGLHRDNVIMVGDSLHDLLAARAAGMRGLGVLTGVAPRAELAPHAVAVLDHIGQIPDWLDQAAQH